MAKMNVKMPDDFLQKVSRLGEKTDDIIPRVLKAGADVVMSKVKSNLQAVVGKGTKNESRSTGELVSALGISPAKVDRNGNHDIKVGFSEPRGDGGSNAKIANILEYGKSGQAAKPFLSPAKSATRKPCAEAMIQALESEMKSV
jgi:HK97 gp10 family phage protein